MKKLWEHMSKWYSIQKIIKKECFMDRKLEKYKIEESFHIFAGKWKLVILMLLFNGGTKRFNELMRIMPNITQKTLTKQLKELEGEDIVKRVIYPQVPPRVEYSITEYGRSLEPVLKAMHQWGISHALHKEKRADSQNIE